MVLSTDPAHSLSDSLETELGPDPTPVSDLLWAQEVQAEREMEANWAAVQRWLGALLADRGVMDIAAEELSVPPGMDELFSLLQIKRHHESGRFDAVIVDCAPTGETLRLLGFPDIAHWWLEKVFPWERRLVAAAKPIARMIDVEVPGEDVLDEVQQLVRHLIAMNEILRDRTRATIRLVDQPRSDGDQGGAAHVHLPQPLRLSDRRRDRQPDLPRRARRRLLRGVARPPARAPGGGSRRASPRCRCSRRATSTRRWSARGCSTGLGTSSSATRWRRPTSCTPSSRTRSSPRTGPPRCGSSSRSGSAATCG